MLPSNHQKPQRQLTFLHKNPTLPLSRCSERPDPPPFRLVMFPKRVSLESPLAVRLGQPKIVPLQRHVLAPVFRPVLHDLCTGLLGPDRRSISQRHVLAPILRPVLRVFYSPRKSGVDFWHSQRCFPPGPPLQTASPL